MSEKLTLTLVGDDGKLIPGSSFKCGQRAPSGELRATVREIVADFQKANMEIATKSATPEGDTNIERLEWVRANLDKAKETKMTETITMPELHDECTRRIAQAIIDPTKLNEAQVDSVESMITSGFWMQQDMIGVEEFVDSFRKANRI